MHLLEELYVRMEMSESVGPGIKRTLTLPAPYYKVESCNKLSPCVKMSGHCWGIESDGVGV